MSTDNDRPFPTDELFPPGTRIRLIKMGVNPCPIEPGDTGTIEGEPMHWQDGTKQYRVKWDSGRGLALMYPVDKFEVIPPAASLK